MVAGVYGELTADGKQIVLAATGDDFELDRAAAALRRLTMPLEKTDPPGLLLAPATWAAVTQLAFTFNGVSSLGRWMPQARLRDWITEEFLRRCRERAEEQRRNAPKKPPED